jgi:ribokinase
MSCPVVILGQIARDLVLRIDEVPAAHRSTDVSARREMLGGKGANIAVGLAQLGVPVAVLGVVGDDLVGGQLIEQCVRDGLDTRAVVRRPGAESALMVDIVTADGRWRYLESVPAGTLVTAADVRAHASLLGSTGTMIIQLQQPGDAALAAVAAVGPDCRIVLDGVPESDHSVRHALLASATVLRCDSREAELLTGRPIPSSAAARAAARELLAAGPDLVVFAVGDEGNLGVWPGGEVLVPLADAPVVDATGGGDAFVAALTWALSHDTDLASAVRLATAAAGLTVTHLGGRPDLEVSRLHDQAARAADRSTDG